MSCHKCLLYTRILIYLSTILLHGTNVVVMLSSFSEEAMKIEGVRNFYRTQYYYFTCWNFSLQMVYAGLSVVCDWLALRNDSEKKPAVPDFVTSLRDNIFTVLIWPGAMLTATYFWALYNYDRNLVYPEYFDLVISDTSNHIMHTMIAVVVLLEILLYPRRMPDSNFVRVCCIVGFEAVYICMIYFVHRTTGIWLYPIFGALQGTKYLPVTFCVTALYLTLIYYAQFWASSLVFKCRQKIAEKYCRACQK